MLTQIYSVASPEEARAICAIGIDHIGAVVGPGQFPREQSIAAAHKIAAAVRRPSKFSALFLTTDVSLIAAWAHVLRPAILHLGAATEVISPVEVGRLKQKLPHSLVMRSVPVLGEQSLAIARSYDKIADFLLLDSIRPSDRKFGALGVTHDWSISRRIVESIRIPVILAGGLGPDNVAEAIRLVRPAGVDSKTKTDLQGSDAKDLVACVSSMKRRGGRSKRRGCATGADVPAHPFGLTGVSFDFDRDCGVDTDRSHVGRAG